jgi:hypothetical protein
MICPAAWPSSTAILSAVEAPAVRRLRRRGLDLGEIEARRALRMREGQQSEPSATFGSIACFCASLPHSAIRPAPITTVER